MNKRTTDTVSTPVVACARPKKSARVSLGLVAAVAASLVACGTSEPMRCVDQSDRVVDDGQCGSATGTVASYHYRYHWYYGGRGLRLGEMASGGSHTPRSGASYHSSTTRGGFGHSAVAHASGGQG
jgi:hypothetical protein